MFVKLVQNLGVEAAVIVHCFSVDVLLLYGVWLEMMGRLVSRMGRGQGGWEEMLCFVATSKCRAGIGELLKRVVPCMKSPSLFFVFHKRSIWSKSS